MKINSETREMLAKKIVEHRWRILSEDFDFMSNMGGSMIEADEHPIVAERYVQGFARHDAAIELASKKLGFDSTGEVYEILNLCQEKHKLPVRELVARSIKKG